MFADGLAASADQARRRMLDLADVQSELKVRLQASRIRTANARRLVDFALARPTFTIRQAAAALDMRYQGAKKLVDSLVTLGIHAEYGDRVYNRRLHSPRVVSILLREQ